MRSTDEQLSLKRRKAIWMRFTISISMVVALFILGVFVGLFVRNTNLIEDQLLTRARALFHTIVVTRAWNAVHSGVYVEKVDGVISNPYLENPDIYTRDGRVFTLRNPAIMTREISEFATNSALASFRIVSTDPLNPNNLPDDFETKAFRAFNRGDKEHYDQHEDGSRYTYRYAAPLMIEESCLSCHSKQGYKLGEIRGAISVSFDISDVKKAMSTDSVIIFVLCAASLFALLGVIYVFIQRLMHALDAAHARIVELASTDSLTGLANRRVFFERVEDELVRSRRYGHSLSCIMIDLDHFKEVNDTFGHDAGDKVLTKVAEIAKKMNRCSDMVARYGGEELVVLLPETECDGAQAVAEKTREALEDHTFDVSYGRTVQLTASFGVACVSPEMLSTITGPDALIRLADTALYEAKNLGRNMVCINNDLDRTCT